MWGNYTAPHYPLISIWQCGLNHRAKAFFELLLLLFGLLAKKNHSTESHTMATDCIQKSHDASLIALEALPHGQSDTSSPLGPEYPLLEKWNQPRVNIHRTFAAFWSFLVMGANDAAYGVS